MAITPGVTRFYQGEQRRGRWSFYSRGNAELIYAGDLVGRIVNMSTRNGMVYDSARVVAFDGSRGILHVDGGVRQSVSDVQPVPTRAAEVCVEDIARGFIHSLPGEPRRRVAPLQVFLLN